MVSHAARAGGVAVMAVLALAACGEGTASTEESSSTESTAADPFADFTACLAEQGIELPEGWTPFGAGGMPGEMPTGEPPPGEMPTEGEVPADMPSGAPGGGFGDAITAPDGVDEADWTAATEACADRLPQGMPGGGAPPDREPATIEETDA